MTIAASSASPDAPASTPPDHDTGLEHVLYDPSTSNPAPSSGVFADIYRQICRVFLKLTGWRMQGDWPDHDKMVLVAAPHTSNWDGIYMLAAAGYYRVPLRWMGKASLTKGLFGGFVKWMGCVPVERDQKNDAVQQMADAFAATDKMVLAVPPEGTRAKTPGWKTGFYHIAHKAGVPIVLSVLDFGTRTIRLAGHVRPTGDYDSDLRVILTHYVNAKGLRVGQFSKDKAVVQTGADGARDQSASSTE